MDTTDKIMNVVAILMAVTFSIAMMSAVYIGIKRVDLMEKHYARSR